MGNPRFAKVVALQLNSPMNAVVAPVMLMTKALAFKAMNNMMRFVKASQQSHGWSGWSGTTWNNHQNMKLSSSSSWS